MICARAKSDAVQAVVDTLFPVEGNGVRLASIGCRWPGLWLVWAVLNLRFAAFLSADWLPTNFRTLKELHQWASPSVEVVPGACITVLLLFRNLTVVSELFFFHPGPFLPATVRLELFTTGLDPVFEHSLESHKH